FYRDVPGRDLTFTDLEVHKGTLYVAGVGGAGSFSGVLVVVVVMALGEVVDGEGDSLLHPKAVPRMVRTSKQAIRTRRVGSVVKQTAGVGLRRCTRFSCEERQSRSVVTGGLRACDATWRMALFAT
ncbi:MAG: hypothetical protein AAFX99_07300, partial [Myxococcota bacterium]